MEVSENVNWFAVLGVVFGAVVANLVHWGIASINGMVVAAVCYLIGRAGGEEVKRCNFRQENCRTKAHQLTS